MEKNYDLSDIRTVSLYNVSGILFFLRLCLGFILLNITNTFSIHANKNYVATVLLKHLSYKSPAQGTIRKIYTGSLIPGGTL